MKSHNQRMLQQRPEGTNALRIYHRKAHGTQCARYLVKCGCCEERVEIYYDDDELEINGVNGSIADWSAIFLALLSPDTSDR